MLLRQIINSTTLFFIALSFFSCTKEADNTLHANRTVIVYMAADNNLSYFALRNVLQMQKGWNDNFDGHLIVYLDRGENATPAHPIILKIQSSLLSDTTKIISSVVKTYPASNSCNPNHMKSVIEYIINAYPANSYGLILWSHGTSWFPENIDFTKNSTRLLNTNTGIFNNLPLTKMFGLDNGSTMSIFDLADALPIKFDFIVFDACFMGSIEVEYELRHKADYIMASSAEIISYGFPYEKIMPYLFSQQYNLQKIGDEFIDFYNNQSGYLSTATISIIKTARLETLKNFTTQIFKTAKSMRDITLSAFQQLEKEKKNRIFDMSQVLLNINNDFSNLNFLNDVIIYKNSTFNLWEEPLSLFSGLSMFMPTESTK